MANSKSVWSITYSDYTVEFVLACNVWQIIDSCKLKYDTDYIVSINRVDFAYGDEEFLDLTNND